MKKRRGMFSKLLGCLLLAILALGLQPSIQLGAIPPVSTVPSDGHDPAAVLATGTVRVIGTPAERDLLNTVFQFHRSLNEEALHTNVSATTCLACHNDIYTKETIRRKLPNEDGSITVSDEINQHAKHQAKPYLNYDENCTFCHIEFVAVQEETQVTIAGYVEKTTCAGCHSRFSPRDYMLEEYYQTDGCPGCHGESWLGPHVDKEIFTPVILTENIDISEQGCLICHGYNKNKVPDFLQDIFWETR